ncbi:MAG: 6,7-dimethyl-8-ribityllumazine synthase [Phycisphaerales bacterium]|nr:6,7-dimethyl-8-ribityllumazine synthase [Phycisphaerales bacterium]MCB9841358.1 6,7-dimethyl-8-ribityllumazine synthase [Phycisphaeraceae bacterium]
MPTAPRTASKAASKRPPDVAIVVSAYNRTITDHMLQGAVREYEAAGGKGGDLAIVEAPGAYELPLLVMEASLIKSVRGVVALGCVVRGETDHDRYIAEAIARGLMDVALDTGVPVGFGVLTVNTIEQAIARSGGSDGTGAGNKGNEAMRAVLESIAAIDAIGRAGESGRLRGLRLALAGEAADKAVPGAGRSTAGKTKGSRTTRAKA